MSKSLMSNDFLKWFMLCVTKKYADFKGRASRKEYWMYILVYMVLYILVSIIAAVLASIVGMLGQIVSLVFALGLLAPSIAVAIRRLHDLNKSGWFLLLGLVPIANFYLLYLFIQKGTDGENQFGPVPEGA